MSTDNIQDYENYEISVSWEYFENIIFIKILMHPFHCVDIWTDGAKAMVDKTDSTSVQRKAMAQIMLFTTKHSQ